MTMYNKDDRQKSRLFIASQEAGLSSYIWPSRKALKISLQNIYLMLDLLYHKGKPLITDAVDDSIFLKISKTKLERMLEEDITFTQLLQWWNYN